MYLSRSILSLLALLAVVALPSKSQTAPALSRFIQPNAKALVSIDWKRIRQSDVGAKFRNQSFRPAGTINATMPGIEILDDVDRILVSSSGRPPGDDPQAQPQFLIALAGHFDVPQVRSLLTKYGAKPQMFNSIQVYRPQSPDSKDMAVVPLDSQTILLGDAPSVFASLERSPFSSAPQDANSIIGRAAEMESKYDIWVVASQLDALSGKDLTGTFGLAQLAADAQGFEGGVSIRDGLTADVWVRFGMDSEAKMLVSELEAMLKLLTKVKNGPPSPFPLANKVKLSSDGPVAKMTLRMTTQELETAAVMAASQMKMQARVPLNVSPARAATPNSSNLPVAPGSPAAPKKEEKKVIRIEGLDDGTREIPYGQP